MPEEGARPIEVRVLGSLSYEGGLALQEEMVLRRRLNEIPDQLLLLEHPPVITLGTSSRADNVLLSPRDLAARGIRVYEVGRGGDVTYHGPGQLVGYPILDLNPDRRDLHRYLRDLESALLHAIGEFGIEGHREEGLTGVWVPEGKLAAIGVRVSSGWITSHGFALNVDPDLDHFSTIVPCGIRHRPVTSMSRCLHRPVRVQEVVPAVIRGVEAVFFRTASVV